MFFFNYLKNNLFYFLIVAFFFISSFSISLIPKVKYVNGQLKDSYEFEVSKLPVLKNTDGIPVLSAQGVFAFDLDSAVVLYEKNPDLLLFPASTTKIITALVAMDHYADQEVLNTGNVSVSGQKMGLEWNENISVNDLLYGLLIHSANDAAEVLAQNHPEGRALFIDEMNSKAKEFYAWSTTFKNPSGLDEEGQLTSARDLARIATKAMQNQEFASIVATKEYVAKSDDGKIVHYLSNRNELLGKVNGVLGIKTGWTENARENLVTYVERDEKHIILALLGSQDRFGETEELVEWIFSNYDWLAIDQEHLSALRRNSR